LNTSKCTIKELGPDVGFTFVGFEFRIKQQAHRKFGYSVYNFPPIDKVSKLINKVEDLFEKHKNNNEALFITMNQVIRGWCSFYASGNSKLVFQKLQNTIWHKLYSFFYEKYSLFPEFKRTSKKLFKKKLSSYIWNKHLKFHMGLKRWWYVGGKERIQLTKAEKKNSATRDYS